jgi:hypothetical protein
MTRAPVSTAFVQKVEAALPRRAGATPRQIFDSIDLGTPTTVRHAILMLVNEGRATFDGEFGRRRYRRVVQRPDASMGRAAGL